MFKSGVMYAAVAVALIIPAAAMADNNKGKGPQGPQGEQGETGAQGAQGGKGDKGDRGVRGKRGKRGKRGRTGATGAQGVAGADGVDGLDGLDGTSPLGALSFSVASSTFSGDGIGIGLSASNFSDLEGSVVLGLSLGNDWRLVAGITTDFDDRHAVSIGVGFSF